jgi:hypothetical protein
VVIDLPHWFTKLFKESNGQFNDRRAQVSESLRSLILRIGGALLVVLGALHLAVTPFIRQMIESNTTPEAAQWLSPPMLLNHVVVGILLLPLGVLTFYAAPAAVSGERWALIVTRTTALTVATLPITVFLLVGTRYFGALPFLIAMIVVCSASIVLLAAAFWPRRQEPGRL